MADTMIDLGRGKTVEVGPLDDMVWLALDNGMGAYATAMLTMAQARILGNAIIDAAAELAQSKDNKNIK